MSLPKHMFMPAPFHELEPGVVEGVPILATPDLRHFYADVPLQFAQNLPRVPGRVTITPRGDGLTVVSVTREDEKPVGVVGFQKRGLVPIIGLVGSLNYMVSPDKDGYFIPPDGIEIAMNKVAQLERVTRDIMQSTCYVQQNQRTRVV